MRRRSHVCTEGLCNKATIVGVEVEQETPTDLMSIRRLKLSKLFFAEVLLSKPTKKRFLACQNYGAFAGMPVAKLRSFLSTP